MVQTVKNLPECGKPKFDPWVGKIRGPGEGNGNPPPVFLPGEFHGQRSLDSYSPWVCKESDMTEQLTHTHTHTRSGESHGQRSLDSYSPWGCKESDMTEQLTHTHTYTHVHMCAIYFYVISATGCILSVRNPRLTARLSCT